MNFWKNLHPLLRRNEHEDINSANGAVLHAIANSLTKAENKVIADRFRESLQTASSEYLDYWGTWFGLLRKQEETDDHYRERMKHYLLLARGTKNAIIDAIRYYLDDTNSYINIYEPWKNVFTLDKSKLDSADHLQGNYYRYGVIDISLGVPLDDNILRVIEAFKPVGVKVYSNYNPLMNKDFKVTYLGTQDADTRLHLYIDLGGVGDNAGIQLGLDDYNFKKVRLSNLDIFVLDKSKLDSNNILTNPEAPLHKLDNMLLGTSETEQLRKLPFVQDVFAKPTVRYTFRGFINPSIRARISLNFLNDANVIINSVDSKEIKHNSGKLQGGFSEVNLTSIAPDRTTSVQIAIDNRTSYTDNLVKNSHVVFHSSAKNEFPVAFDLGKDLGSTRIVTKVEFTVTNLKNTGYLAIVDGQDTGNWETLVPQSITTSPPNVSSNERFKLDRSKLDSANELTRANIKIEPVQPISANGTYTYTLETDKHVLKDNAKNNRIFVKTNLDADIDLKVKLAVKTADTDMAWSHYLNEEGYYNDYLIKAFKLVSGDSPNLSWTPAPSEVQKASPYYVDIVSNTNIKLIERELRATKTYNARGAKLSFAKLHNRNIALNTGIPVVKQNLANSVKLYDLSLPIVKGKSYTVLMNYASDDVDKAKRIVITVADTDEEVLNVPLYTDGDNKTYNGVYNATKDIKDKYLTLSIKNGVASDLYILNFKLGID
jgi:hypothetical protein